MLVCAAGAVVDAVKTGKLEHIFVIGGCDGSEPQRKYYDKLARLMPLNTMVRGVLGLLLLCLALLWQCLLPLQQCTLQHCEEVTASILFRYR